MAEAVKDHAAYYRRVNFSGIHPAEVRCETCGGSGATNRVDAMRSGALCPACVGTGQRK